jgi:hypothetical protein
MSTTLYHTTSRANAMAILKEGFEGSWGDAGYGVYLWACEATAQDYLAAGGWAGELGDDAVILEVEAPESEIDVVVPDPAWSNPQDYEQVRWVPMDDSDQEARWRPLRMIPEETGEFILEISVAKLREIADPIASPPWGSQSAGLTEAMVRGAMEHDETVEKPVNNRWDTNPETHAGRIAHLARKGWSDEITLELGEGGRWPVTDGNHRYYAAIIRGDETIFAKAVGDWELLRTLRPDPTPLPSAPALTF